MLQMRNKQDKMTRTGASSTLETTRRGDDATIGTGSLACEGSSREVGAGPSRKAITSASGSFVAFSVPRGEIGGDLLRVEGLRL